MKPTLLNIPVFLFTFLLLILVLGFNSWRQYQQNQEKLTDQVRLTLDNYAQQSGLLAQAGLSANRMFCQSYAGQLEAAVNGDSGAINQLWPGMKQSLFNLSGFTLFSSEGEFLLQQGTSLNRREVTDIHSNIRIINSDQGVFSLRYGNKGGYYFYTRFIAPSGKQYLFVSRRAYSKLSQIIYNGHFPGFEMLLMNTTNNTISIREFYYADTSNQPPLSSIEEEQIIYRANIPYTRWDVIAIPVSNSQLPTLWMLLQNPLMLLITFALLAFVLWAYMYRQERRTQALDTIRRQTERRADRVLSSIDDAVISTDAEGLIDYVNPKAAALLLDQGAKQFIGHTLAELWPDPHALWNLTLDATELEVLSESRRQLIVCIENTRRTLEQVYNPLYQGRSITGIVWLLRDITDTVQASRAVEESRLRYKALFEEAGVAHCIMDISGFRGSMNDIRLIDVNDAAVRLSKTTGRDYLIHHFQDMVADGHHEFQSALSRAKELKLSTTEFETTLRTFDGDIRNYWINLSLNTGSEKHIMMTLLDITERKKATEKIREREAFWSTITAAMPDLVYVIELDDQLNPHTLYSNRSVGDILGYPRKNSSDTSWLDYAEPGEDKNIVRNIAINRTLKHGETYEATARFRHYDGTTRILKSRDTPLSFDDKGNVKRYIGSARDVTDDIEKQERILESERRYRLLAENINDVIWATDIDLNFNFVSSSVERALGYKPDELLREGVSAIFKKSDIRTLVKKMRQEIQQALSTPDKVKKRKTPIRSDIIARSKSGAEVLLELQSTVLWNDKGELQGILGICRDVGEARKIEQELRLAAEVFANSNEAILITDNTMNIVSINTAFSSITGYSSNQVIGRTPDFLIANQRHDISLYEKIGESLVVDGYWQGEIFYQCNNGDVRTGWAGVSAIRDNDHEIQSLIIIMSDITERKIIEERIHRLAYFDSLTGLPNRTQMHERLDIMLKSAKRNQTCVALLFIDLDRFKPINDSMGHPAGDQVLTQVAQRLRNATKKNDLVARMGGDEFTVALADQYNTESAGNTGIKVAERILHTLNEPYILDQREVFISASIGIAIYPDDGNSVIELLKNSDMAMYHAKSLGRDNAQFFNKKMNEKAVELLELENDLRHAQGRDELELYYQPQYQSGSGNVVAVEALLRWNHPQKGLISPGMFIPIIEDTGLIVPIGQWVIEEACQQLALWNNEGLDLQRIAVNVSARQFKHDNFIDIVKDAIFKSGIRPNQLELELTESILIDDIAHTLAALNALRALGVRTAIDDFGTGYSSLNYLKQFPVDTLKIDRSFIQNLPTNNDDAQITRTIIAMAHNLGMGVIAEGVETSAQLDFLISAQCEEVQGFLFSKPLPQKDLKSLLQQTADSKP